MTDANTTATTLTGRPVGDPMEALTHFFIMASQSHHSAARVAATMLLSFYNGNRFQFDLTDLRLLDGANLERAIALMRLDARPTMEVHEWLNRLYRRSDFGQRFEHLAHRWKLKGRCKKEGLMPVPAIRWSEGGEA